MAGDKRFPATKQRIKKALEQGDTPKSKDASAVVGVSAGIFWILFVTFKSSTLQDFYIKLAHDIADFHTDSMLLYARVAFRVLVEILGPFLALMFLLTALIEFAQGGFRLSFNAISFKLNRLNAVENLKNIFRSSESSPPTKIAYEVLRRGFMLVIFFGVSASAIFYIALEFLHSNVNGPSELNLLLSRYATFVAMISLATFAIYGCLDLFISRKRWKDKLRMDVEEYKKELKDTDGNPELKGMRNQLHQEILRKSLIEGVRKASVVISNK